MSGPKGIDFYYGDGTPSIAGQTFDVIKASEGAGFPPDGPIPDWYAAEQARIRAAGALFGAYHFWHPSVDNAAQLANFLRRANLQDGDVIQLDAETTDGLDWATVNSRKNDMLARLKSARPRNRVLLYTYLDFWNHLDANAGDGLWIADPSAPPGQPRVPHWVIHQYGSGGVDYDIANFPDAAALRVWANGLIPATPTQEDDQMFIVQFNADPADPSAGSGIFLLSGGKLLAFANANTALAFKNQLALQWITVTDGPTLSSFIAASNGQTASITIDSSQLAAALAADLPKALEDPTLLADVGQAVAHAEAVQEHNDTPAS
jgi:hypothetical protein